jgi:hypothetical protein
MSRIDTKCSPGYLKDFVAVLPRQFKIEKLNLDSYEIFYDITIIAPDDLAPGFYNCEFSTRPTGFSMDFVPAKVFTGTSHTDAKQKD